MSHEPLGEYLNPTEPVVGSIGMSRDFHDAELAQMTAFRDEWQRRCVATMDLYALEMDRRNAVMKECDRLRSALQSIASLSAPECGLAPEMARRALA